MCRILVVDDNPDFCNTLGGLLSDEGHTTRLATNEREALAAVTQEPFDFALIDVRLHDGGKEDESGLSLAIAIRALKPHIRVILLTRYIQTNQIVRAVRYHGVVDFIEKTPDVGEHVLRTIAAARKKVKQSKFEVRGEATQLSLSLEARRPLRVRTHGLYVCSTCTPEILQLDIDDYARRTEIAQQDLANLRFQVRSIGRDLWREIFLEHPDVERAYLKACAGSQSFSLLFETPREFLKLPLEFTRSNQPQEYLNLLHPIARFVCGAIPKRQALSPHMLALREELRILIIASNTHPPINGVDAEAMQLYKYLKRQHFIPVTAKLVPTKDASYERVREELRHGEYDIIHYAGHGSYDAESPEESCLYFWADRNKQGKVMPMRATELKLLLEQSQIHLAYLSCCYGAATGSEIALLDDDFLGLVDAVTQAGVPSVLGFRWPVSDEGAHKLALAFYQSLLEQGSPEVALWRARRELAVDREDTTWLSPILIHQV
jgi:CheY-like chemotaxis protein